ncbi:NADH-quinone oxidoreductase subunit H [Candidatus Xenohaliotis californiensis]|uniref:NADH-quinone oxidoreductase subunit H n=1 Tax=Candidatus Xenohaliotis californiensis TaxID=84677 RepID=A0ABM9N9E6_9RICK|nr:NADH-quinone oxidoreductase subunit H [Candidatus Xenohaliotis californiensis]
MHNVLLTLLQIIALLAIVLICVAYLIYAERKIIGFMQLRVGPNIVGPFGLLQPIADAIKLATKQFIIPANIKKFGFIIAPIITFWLSLAGWAVIPFDITMQKYSYKAYAVADINVGVLYLMASSSLGVYGIIVAGWASNSKYSFLGGMRAAAQMISYELLMSTTISSTILCAGSLNLAEIVEHNQMLPIWIKLALLPMAVIFFITILAETKRHPFDLPEAESELMAGYTIEYSSMPFGMFFLGEYANMILTSTTMALLFLGGWYPPCNIKFLYNIPGIVWLSLKVAIILFCFIWIRAALPRYRYDQLMKLCWKKLLPIAFIWLIILSFMLLYTGKLPVTITQG